MSEMVAEPAEPGLRLESKIPLGDVRGRIDHMAIDPKRHRVFVAELGNDTVGVVGLDEGKVLNVITGFNEPQGVGYVPSSDELYVSSGGDGSVKAFNADSFEPTGQIDLGQDADNIRVDAATNQVFVGYGHGGLAVIDPATHRKIGDIALKGHPEGFQLVRSSAHIFVNTPRAAEIAVIDRVSKRTLSWSLRYGGNFPMAIDEESGHVVVAFRTPPAIGVFSAQDGANLNTVESCGDADDLFIDSKRHQAYLSCGSGFLDVFDTQGASYRRVAHIVTASGARTSLFVPELDRFLLAVRASAGEPAAVWIFRPVP